MTQTLKGIGIAVLLLLTAFVLFQYATSVHASITNDSIALSNQYRTYELLASTTAESTIATTTSATSTNIIAYADSSGRIINGTADVRGAKKVTFYFSIGGLTHTNTGTTTFSIQTSRDGTNWVNFNRLLQDTATSSTPLYVSSIQIPLSGPTATTTQDFVMDMTGGYSQVRCIAVVQDGEESGCAVGVTY